MEMMIAEAAPDAICMRSNRLFPPEPQARFIGLEAKTLAVALVAFSAALFFATCSSVFLARTLVFSVLILPPPLPLLL